MAIGLIVSFTPPDATWSGDAESHYAGYPHPHSLADTVGRYAQEVLQR